MGKKAEIERDGDRVRITVQCSEVYEAMQLYDELVEALEWGHLRLAVTTRAEDERAQARLDRRQTGLFE